MITGAITACQNIGLKVVATVCDQGSANQNAINSLLADINEKCLREPIFTTDNSRSIHHTSEMSTQTANNSTDTVGEVSSSPKAQPNKTGKGSRKRRTDEFRKKKNAETDATIMSGVFARFKISDPTAVATIPISRETHPVTVPITFNKLPTYLDRVWDTMEAIGTRPFSQLDTFNNKMIFLKGMLILSEIKVCYAQRAHVDKPDEDLPAKRLYTEEKLRDFNNMASTLPYPLAIWLESIGNAVDGRQIITPLLAEIAGNENRQQTFWFCH
jgi:hypothetical protein